MGVAVLNPQDCLQNPLSSQTITFTPKKTTRYPNPNPNPNPNGSTRTRTQTQTQQRNRSKRSTSRPKNPSPSKVEKPAAAAVADLVMGQVKILKRGEELAEATTKNCPPPRKVANKDEKRGAPVKGSRNQPGSDSKFYAGSLVSIASPPPSSLPIPFFTKKSVVGLSNDEATNGLLKILRLDLV